MVVRCLSNASGEGGIRFLKLLEKVDYILGIAGSLPGKIVSRLRLSNTITNRGVSRVLVTG
jgi:hypothetical protein